MHEPLRIGVLGAARISDLAIVQPAHELGARLVSVAARDRSRAEAFASRHGFEKVLDNYQAVIDDPDVEVIYNPLANALHGPWNLRAIEGGKHVLTEKPFSSNVEEARRVRDAAKAAGVHVVEAVHSEYHPMMARMIELAGSGEIGDLEYVEVRMLMPPPACGRHTLGCRPSGRGAHGRRLLCRARDPRHGTLGPGRAANRECPGGRAPAVPGRRCLDVG